MIDASDRSSRHGLLINITGNGKGKTTGGLGTCLRALGWGWKVAVIQFVKGNGNTGESHFAQNTSLPLEFMTCGCGFSFGGNEPSTHRECAEAAFSMATDYLMNGKVDLLMLDELNIALGKGWLDTSDVIAALKKRPEWMHVIITGRGAPKELVDASDLVSEIAEVKHPFRSGITAQPGIDF